MSLKVPVSKNRKVVLIADVKDAPFKCLACKKVFISEGHLGRHYNRRHPSLNSPSQTLASKVMAPRGPGHQESDQQSLNAVLNATERIECLLANLTYGSDPANKCPAMKNIPNVNNSMLNICKSVLKGAHASNSSRDMEDKSSFSGQINSPLSPDMIEADKTFDLPLANSTQHEINSDSLEDIGSYLESREFSDDTSDISNIDLSMPGVEEKMNYKTTKQVSSNDTSNSSVAGDQNEKLLTNGIQNATENGDKIEDNNSEEKEVLHFPDKTYSCLDPEENEVFKRMVSPTDDSNINVAVECNTTKIIPSTSLSVISRENISTNDSSLKLDHETLTEAKIRLKNNAISKLNYKLRSFGVDPNWQTIPNKTAHNVQKLLNAERKELCKNNPDYSKLRDLINHNANTRIKMSMQS